MEIRQKIAIELGRLTLGDATGRIASATASAALAGAPITSPVRLYAPDPTDELWFEVEWSGDVEPDQARPAS